MKKLFRLTAGKTLWCDKTELFVAAESSDAAKACLTSGSDSLWCSVAKCEEIGIADSDILATGIYEHAGGKVVSPK